MSEMNPAVSVNLNMGKEFVNWGEKKKSQNNSVYIEVPGSLADVFHIRD